MAFLSLTGLERLWQHIILKLDEKVTKIEGKGLSTNDYTTAEKIKLAGIAEEATNFSGDYNDLINKPTIPSINGLASETYVNNKIAGLVNSAPETLDTLGELAIAFKENKDMVSVLDGAITTKADIKDLEPLIKKIVTSVTSPLILDDNTEYHLTNVSSLTFSSPPGNFEVWMNLSFASSGAINVVWPAEMQYIGSFPTFKNGETWEISIKDNVAICWRIK